MSTTHDQVPDSRWLNLKLKKAIKNPFHSSRNANGRAIIKTSEASSSVELISTDGAAGQCTPCPSGFNDMNIVISELDWN